MSPVLARHLKCTSQRGLLEDLLTMPTLVRPNGTTVNQSDEGVDANHAELSPQMIGVIIAGLATFLALATLVVAVLQLRQGTRRSRANSDSDIESPETLQERSTCDYSRAQTEQSFRSESTAISVPSSVIAAHKPDVILEMLQIERSHGLEIC